MGLLYRFDPGDFDLDGLQFLPQSLFAGCRSGELLAHGLHLTACLLQLLFYVPDAQRLGFENQGLCLFLLHELVDEVRHRLGRLSSHLDVRQEQELRQDVLDHAFSIGIESRSVLAAEDRIEIELGRADEGLYGLVVSRYLAVPVDRLPGAPGFLVFDVEIGFLPVSRLVDVEDRAVPETRHFEDELLLRRAEGLVVVAERAGRVVSAAFGRHQPVGMKVVQEGRLARSVRTNKGDQTPERGEVNGDLLQPETVADTYEVLES